MFTSLVHDEVPAPVQIRTGEGNESRYHAIRNGADFYNCNRSDAVAFACKDVDTLVGAARRALGHDDLTLKRRRKSASALSTRVVTFDVEIEAPVTGKGEQ